ncbi:hypothetical protein HanIR_Chr12g0576421 [Helianthus annuus]|nr:hypothetical protein HanIR_Chr12g0576421 [Helianthus annuus]
MKVGRRWWMKVVRGGGSGYETVMETVVRWPVTEVKRCDGTSAAVMVFGCE